MIVIGALAKLALLQAWVCVSACAACKCANVRLVKITRLSILFFSGARESLRLFELKKIPKCRDK
jgi:hypothetical protein